jgi:hypothetical protein
MKDPVLQDGLLTGRFDGEFLSYTRYGELHGEVLGTYDTEEETWQAAAAGYWNETHTLKFNGLVDGEIMAMVRKNCCTSLTETGWASGLMGGLSDLWSASRESPAETRFMGDYDAWLEDGTCSVFSMGVRSYNPYDDTVTLWNPEDNSQNGAYHGFLAGRENEEGEGEGTALALYLDQGGNAGILKGRLDLETCADLEMWEGEGTLFPLPLWEDTGYKATDFHPENLLCTESATGILQSHTAFMVDSHDDTACFGDVAWTRYKKDKAALWKPGVSPSVLGATSILYGGVFCNDNDGGPSEWTGWSSEIRFDHENAQSRSVLFGAPGSWSDEKLSGKGYEAWVNWDASVTGVSGAELKGTFDPNSYTCQAAALWASMDTNTFMNLAHAQAGRDQLAELNIPCVQVGRASLSGEDDVLDVSMQDVTFFAYSTGHDPRIWATKNVGGTYFEKPEINHTLPLHGGGLSADFQVRKWGSNKWGASIHNGAGSLKREDISGSVHVNFTGAAAGSYSGNDQGTFSGNASGIVAPAPLAIEKVD